MDTNSRRCEIRKSWFPPLPSSVPLCATLCHLAHVSRPVLSVSQVPPIGRWPDCSRGNRGDGSSRDRRPVRPCYARQLRNFRPNVPRTSEICAAVAVGSRFCPHQPCSCREPSWLHRGARGWWFFVVPGGGGRRRRGGCGWCLGARGEVQPSVHRTMMGAVAGPTGLSRRIPSGCRRSSERYSREYARCASDTRDCMRA